MTCAHENFAAEVKVARIGDGENVIRNFVAEVTVRCVQCETPFHFIGPEAGFSFKRPTVSVEATTLHAPIAPGVGPVPQRIRFEVG